MLIILQWLMIQTNVRKHVELVCLLVKYGIEFRNIKDGGSERK